MRIVTCANLKGGVGRSLLTFNLSSIIARDRGKKLKSTRILIFDIDPQANISSNFGVDKLRINAKTIIDVFENNIPAEEVIVKTKIPNVSIVMGSLNLITTEIRMVSLVARELILKNWIDENRVFLEANFDILMFDTPPHFNVICQNAFIISDSILLINNVSINSLEGAEQFCALWRAIRMQLKLPNNVDAFIVNRVNMNQGIDKEFYDHIKRHPEFSTILFETYIPNLIAYVNTELENEPINYIRPSSQLKKHQIVKAQEYIYNLEEELRRRNII